jgi:arginase family enzyme
VPQREQVHYYTGPVSFFRAPICRPEELPEGSVAVLGVPLDSWTVARNGQRFAPRAIREASLYLAGYYAVQSKPEGYVDVTTGDVWTVPEKPRLFDVGDARLVQQDPEATTRLVADQVRTIVERGAMPVVLGGDHYVPYPCFLGFVEALQQRKENVKVGFLNIDGHFDFWDEFAGLGRYNHGTFCRRISEHPAVGRMVWWGLNGTHIIEPEPLGILRDAGHVGYTVPSIRRRGVQETMREALDLVSEGADAVYVTYDIDSTDGAYVPAANSIVFDALTPGEVMAGLALIPEYETVQAFDVCEIVPQYDVGGGRTTRFACHVILAVISHRILQSTPMFDRGELDQVFH